MQQVVQQVVQRERTANPPRPRPVGRPSTPGRSGLERTMAELLAAVNLSTSGP